MSRVDRLLNELSEQVKNLQSGYDQLEKENAILRNACFKDDLVVKLNKKINELHARLTKSFCVSDSEWDEIRIWESNHVEECKCGYSSFQYIFQSAGFIDWGMVRCEKCGKEFIFRDAE